MSGPTGSRRYLRQVDLVRIIAFATVIAVHSTSLTVPGTSTGGGIALMLLHCTREVFFLITGFVLIRSYGGKPLAVPSFLQKRCTLAGVPYVVWSLIYFGYDEQWHLHGAWAQHLGYDLLNGTAFYHLYFLLVTLQAYLLLPLLLALLRRTEGHHGILLGASLALNLLTLQGIVSGLTMGGVPRWLAAHAEPALPSYQFYLVAGALAAWHLEAFQQWIDTHTRLLFVGLIGAGALAEIAFALRLSDGPVTASAVLQPAELPWSVAVAACLYAIGSRWVERGPGRVSSAVIREGAFASFGVYLLHPMVLALLGDHGFHYGPGQLLPRPLVTVLAVVLALAITTPIVFVIQRTPLSLPLTGRPRRPLRSSAAHRGRAAPVAAPVAAPASALVVAPASAPVDEPVGASPARAAAPLLVPHAAHPVLAHPGATVARTIVKRHPHGAVSAHVRVEQARLPT